MFDDRPGKLPGKVTLHVDETIATETSAAGRVPESLLPQVKAKLKRLEEMGVITPVDEPTDWNSRMVVATNKSGDICICIDLRPLNKALKKRTVPDTYH